MRAESLLPIHNGQAFDIAQCPNVSLDDFQEEVLYAVHVGARIAALCGYPASDGSMRLLAVLVRSGQGDLVVTSTAVRDEYPSLTPHCPAAHWFEREIAEQWGIRPLGHPWLKPIRFSRARRLAALSMPPVCGDANFLAMAGEEVHEVAVGPVHAGIIEPGHFRFQCHGEVVHHLEISLGYQHRGVERAMVGESSRRTIHYVETLAGDTTVGHTHAHCLAMEAIAKIRAPARAEVLRGVAEELERIANHVGDLGALAGDVAFLPTMSYCGRIRGDVLNMTAALCGNRFGRGFLRQGGVAFDLDASTVAQLLKQLDAVDRDLHGAVDLLWNTASVTARFDQTGQVPPEVGRKIGLVGVAARACGMELDARADLPYGIYRFATIPVSTWTTGDVFARAYVRWLEIQRSLAFVREQIESLPEGAIDSPIQPLAPNKMAVGLAEGWRGEICHLATTGARGELAFYKVVDPSFHNWFGLACALRGQQISDFPLCNKSFNLSYCGHDL